MKRFKIYGIIAFLTAVVMSSCSGLLGEKEFDRALLVGKWQQGDLFYVYEANGNGHTWDEGDDIMESEAQIFTWELDMDVLTQIHIMEIGGNIPKVYTVTELSASRLSYEDDFGKSYTFTKVTE